MTCIYAPPDPHLRGDFFREAFTYVSDQTVFLGDFNSVIDQTDRVSGNLDLTLVYTAL